MAWNRVELRDRTAPPQSASVTPLGLWIVVATAFAMAALVVGPPDARGPAEPPTAEFRVEDHLSTAKVAIRRSGGGEDPCTWVEADGRWHCGAQDFAFVGPYVGLAAGKPMRCLWLHPHPGGATTVIRWPELNLGDHIEARLRLLDDVATGPVTTLQIFAGEQAVGSLSVTDGREHPDMDKDLTTGRGKGELRLELTSPANDWRLACAEVLMTGRRRSVGEAAPVVDKEMKYTPPTKHDAAGKPR